MIEFIKRKLSKRQTKRTFREYSYEINIFNLKEFGKVEYAQWLHPFEGKKDITEEMVAFFKKFIPKNGFAIDIGAHTGDTTIPMALAAGKKGLIIGMEPNLYVFKILKTNAALNPETTNIVPVPFAATEEEGAFTFNYSDASFCNGGYLEKIKNSRHNHHYELEVKGINLQRYLFEHHADDLPRLSLIKVDAEGYDKEILKTLPTILSQYKPSLLVECYKRLDREERKELFQVIASNDYQLFRLSDFSVDTSYTPLTAESMNDHKHFELLALHASSEMLAEINNHLS